MSNSRTTLERIGSRVPVPQPAYDRMMRRRDRKQRNRQVTSAVLALLLAIGAIGAAVKVFESGGRQLPAQQPITPQNIGRLQLLDSQLVGGHLISVQVSDDLAYVVSRTSHRAKLVAFPAGCSTDCSPAWFADTGDAEPRNGSAATGGMVYVATGDLYAFSASCGSGGATCEPSWVGHVDGRPYGPVLGTDALYVVSNRHLYSFPTSCAPENGQCQPNWVSVELPGAAGYHHPVVAGHVVYLGSDPSHSVAFATACGTGAAVCSPLKDAPPPLPSERMIATAGPMIAADGKVFVTSRRSPHQLRAFSAECADPSACRPDWTTLGISSGRLWMLAPGNGLLFVGQHHGGCCGNSQGSRGGILAYPTDCGTGDAVCAPSWTWGTGHEGTVSVPITSLMMTSNRLFAASGDGKLYVFGPGSVVAERAAAPETSATSDTSTLVFYLSLLVVGAVVLLVRRVRRARSAP